MRRSWLVPALLGAAAIVALGVWQPWKKTESTATLAAPGAETKSAAPLSEARQLTLKARALIDDDLLAVRENFRLADELCEKAVKLAPDDGEAWATWARVSSEMQARRYDTSMSRQAAARSQAERAIRLAPDSVEAGLALAPILYGTREWAELERRMRDLQMRAPTDARVLNDQGKDAEAMEIRLKHPAFGGRDPRPLIKEAGNHARKGRMVEMESLVDRAQALAPSHEGYYMKLMLLLRDSHFADAARLYLEALPPQLLLEDAFAGHAAEFWIRVGLADKALAVLRRVSRDFFEDAGQVLPKGYYSGWAQRVAGRGMAAEAEWRQAVSVVDKRLVAEPNQPELLRWKGLLLALTGQTEAAEKTWKLLLELEARPVGRVRWHDVEFHLALGRHEDAIRALQAMRDGGSLGPPRLAGWLRHEPWLAPIRNDPRVQEFIAEQDVRLKELRQKAGIVSGPMPAPAPPNRNPSPCSRSRT